MCICEPHPFIRHFIKRWGFDLPFFIKGSNITITQIISQHKNNIGIIIPIDCPVT
jgi:hypothetical protein